MTVVSRALLGILILVVVIAVGSFWFYSVYVNSPTSTDAQPVTVVLHILDQGSRRELSEVKVEVDGYSMTSGSDGDVQFAIQPGTYTATFTKSGYINATKSFDLTHDQRIPVAMAKAPPSTGTYTLSFLTSDGQLSKPEFRIKADGVFYGQHERGRYDRCTLTLEAVAPAGWKFSRWGYVAAYYIPDRNENPIVIEVDRDGLFEALFEPTGTTPTISVSPTGLSTGAVYSASGSGFTPYGAVYIRILNSDGTECARETIYADESGGIAGTFTMRCGEGGMLRAVDDMTGLESNDLNFTITTPLSTSGNAIMRRTAESNRECCSLQPTGHSPPTLSGWDLSVEGDSPEDHVFP